MVLYSVPIPIENSETETDVEFDVQFFSLETGKWITHSRVSSFVGAHVLARSFETDGTVVRVVEATDEMVAA